MENKLINRDDIFIGIVTIERPTQVTINGSDGKPAKVGFTNSVGEMVSANLIAEYVDPAPLRGIVFKIDENNLSEDLLYAGNPSHLVFHYIIDEIPFSTYAPSKFNVKKPVNIGELLRLLGYDKELSGEELYHFMENILDDEYFKTISELFGNPKVVNGVVQGENSNGLSNNLYQCLLIIKSINKISPSPYEQGGSWRRRDESDYSK